MRIAVSCAMLAVGALSATAQNQSVYTDSLQNGWENWSWATVNLSTASPVHSGTKSAGVTIAGEWQALYLEHAAFDSSGFTNITFWINGGAGGQKLQLQGLLSGTAQKAFAITAPAGWKQITVTLQDLGVANKPDLDGFWIQDTTGAAQPTFYVDDISLTAGAPPPPPGPVTLLVDPKDSRHPIDPRIYGVAFASQAQAADLNTPLNRSGGNSESRYNWQLNAHNRAADWYFESLADTSAAPGASADSFVAATKAAGSEAMLTVPLLSWAPKLGSNRSGLASFSIAKYGAQTDRDSQWFGDAGNGIKSNSPLTYVTGNDPNDANLPVTSSFQMDWVRHVTNRWGTSNNGGVRYYILDNEPSLWNSTHRDIHPAGQTMAELRDKYYEFAPMVKDIDPAALIVGPEEWGWSGYFYSGFDQHALSTNGYTSAPDKEANGHQDYLPWFLDRMRERSATEGRRLLDVFSVHYYPQGGEYGTNVSSSMQLLRNRSTRSLWDTNYTDSSWIGDKVRLIPRLREWVNAHYPGTQIGVTEYSWGADDHISGAIAQADVLGILGREGLDLATRWGTPDTGTPTYNAIKMFRNYDGQKSTFGDVSVRATAPNPDNVAVFAAQRTNGTLTVIAINKQLTTAAPALITLTNFSGTVAQRWQLTSANTITKVADQNVANNVLSNTLPAQSITLFILTNMAPRISSPTTTTSTFGFTLEGVSSRNYAIESTLDLTNWSRLQTNTTTASTTQVSFARSAPMQFYRAVEVP